jgi:hypothetical protein
MTGDAFLAYAAEIVATSNPGEAACRTAISRAYYGVFHIATDFLCSIDPKVGDRHDRIWKYLQISGHPSAIEAGKHLSSLYQERQRADYRLDNERWGQHPHAKKCVERAKSVSELLTTCEPAKDVITAGIQAYLQKLGGRLP